MSKTKKILLIALVALMLTAGAVWLTGYLKNKNKEEDGETLADGNFSTGLSTLWGGNDQDDSYSEQRETIATANSGGFASATFPLKKSNQKLTEVRNLQQICNSFGFTTGGIDGIWGSKTDEAMKKLAEKAEYRPYIVTSGGVQITTRTNYNAIIAKYEGSSQGQNSNLTASSMQESPYPIKVRSGAPAYRQVYNIQVICNAYGYNAGTPDGLFGQNTRTALKKMFDYQPTMSGYIKYFYDGDRNISIETSEKYNGFVETALKKFPNLKLI